MKEQNNRSKKSDEGKETSNGPIPIVAGFIDWLDVGEHHFLITLGLGPNGTLHLLNLSEGDINDFKTSHDHLEKLVQMGYQPTRPTLYVINGSSSLKYIVPGILGEYVILQRCQLRCVEQLSQSLPDDPSQEIQTKMQDFFELTYNSSMAGIQSCSTDVMSEFPTVAANMLENSEETMTTSRLGLPMPLKISLATTSMIWQQPPSVLKQLNKVVKENNSEMLIDQLSLALQKRIKKISPILGYEDLWLLEPALHEEINLTNTMDADFDFREILNKPDEQISDDKTSRRRHPRWKVSHVNGFIQHTIEAEVLDIGMTGLAAQTNMPLSIGALHNVRLQHSEGIINLKGRVAWCRLEGSKKNEKGETSLVYMTGIEFEDTLTESGRNVRFFFDKLVQINLDRRIFGRFQYEDEDAEETSVEMGELTPFKVSKVSLSGMLIDTDFVPEKETILSLEVRLGEDSFFSTGRVAYTETIEKGQFQSRIGLEFVGITEENRIVLENFLKNVID